MATNTSVAAAAASADLAPANAAAPSVTTIVAPTEKSTTVKMVTVVDNVKSSLATLNSSTLAKPQFWLCLIVVAVIIFAIWQYKKNKDKKKAAPEPEQEELRQVVTEEAVVDNN